MKSAARHTMAFALVAAAFAGAVHAQTPDLDAAHLQVLQQQLEAARQTANDSDRAAYAAQTRVTTEQTVRDLAASRAAADAISPDAPIPTPPPLPPGPPNPAATVDSQLIADGDRIMQLQAQAMAGSNARILAVKPAL